MKTLIHGCVSAAEENARRRQAKASNKNGNPIEVGSKILDVAPDPLNEDNIYIAESSGVARRISLSVSILASSFGG